MAPSQAIAEYVRLDGEPAWLEFAVAIVTVVAASAAAVIAWMIRRDR